MNNLSGHNDQGFTKLQDDKRIKKNSSYMNVYGDIEELVSSIAMIKALCFKVEILEKYNVLNLFSQIQKQLMDISKIITTPIDTYIDDGVYDYLNKFDFPESIIASVEKEIDYLENQLPKNKKSNLLTTTNPIIAQIHISRTLARRTERSFLDHLDILHGSVCFVAQLVHIDKNIRTYLNRISDLLLILTHYIDSILSQQETV
jgi:ATP:cob(I)alamin adenosyltransferase